MHNFAVPEDANAQSNGITPQRCFIMNQTLPYNMAFWWTGEVRQYEWVYTNGNPSGLHILLQIIFHCTQEPNPTCIIKI